MEATLMTTNSTDFTKNWSPTALSFPKKLIEQATEFIETTHFPTTRDEHWKYTRLAKLSKQQFLQSKVAATAEFDSISNSNNRLVFVNGLFNAGLSNLTQSNGLTLTALSENSAVLNQTNVDVIDLFSAMNICFAKDGIHVHVAKNQTIETPIEIVFVQTGEQTAAVIHNQITIDEGAKASVILNFQSKNAKNTFTNVISNVSVGKNAHFTLYKMQTENETATFIGTENVTQERDSYFHIHTSTLNGLLVRNNLNIKVIGENADTHLNGMYLGHGSMHVDNHTVVDHTVANCESNELYKGVMADKSTGVFNGKVFVRKDAQKINAFQSNGNVLLSDDATINSKPELEIYADDVKCSHGSTTGQLDEEAVFYLRARGISEKAARQLMVSAFIGDVINKIDNTEVSDYLTSKLETMFGWDF
ncbi:MAG: Fe-S cluster assembly protein SufD [Bacteroidetes bacterium]|nr:Fe-S cluster assembly protein SufD [Bacteroidota bacterium]